MEQWVDEGEATYEQRCKINYDLRINHWIFQIYDELLKTMIWKVVEINFVKNTVYGNNLFSVNYQTTS